MIMEMENKSPTPRKGSNGVWNVILVLNALPRFSGLYSLTPSILCVIVNGLECRL